MYLVHVYPLLKGVAPHELTYFSQARYTRGGCVRITVRNKEVWGVVAHTESAKEARTRVRSGVHSLSSLKKQVPVYIFLSQFLRAVEQQAFLSGVSVGSLLEIFLPREVGEYVHKKPGWDKEKKVRKYTGHEIACAQTNTDDQDRILKTLAREHLAKRASLLVVTPDRHECERIHALIENGMRGTNITALHGGLSAKEIALRWAKVGTEKKPVVLVTSATYMGIPRKDISKVVLVGESSPLYVHHERPFIDMRLVAEEYARELGVQLLYIDTLLRPRTHQKLIDQTAVEYALLSHIVRFPAPITLITMQEQKHTLLSDTVRTMLKKAEEQKEVVVIFSGRKGIAGTIVCGDCGTTVLCSRCEAPLALFGPKSSLAVPRFYCRHCGQSRDSRERCVQCTSWKLVAISPGSETIEQEIKKCVRHMSVIRLDTESATTDKKARALVDMPTEKGVVYVGTERMLPFIPQQISHVVITGCDALLSLPDIAASEKSMRLFLSLCARATQSTHIQTRIPQHPLYTHLMSGDVKGFVETELAQREALMFPPFAVMIEIIVMGKKEFVQKSIAKIVPLFSSYQPIVVPHNEATGRGTRLVLCVPKDIWPDKELLRVLSGLPPLYKVQVTR